MFKKINKQQQAIGVLILFSVVTYLLRVQLTQSFFFGFLLWNLFLAAIPYIISELLKIKPLKKSVIIFCLFIWLLFLPNAPYLITDFIHLHHLKSTLIWYDLFMLFSFAFTGITLATTSIYDVYKILLTLYSKSIANQAITLISFLCGFGIYLGRFLRLNSWELFTKPFKTLQQITISLTENKAWNVTLGIGVFLMILFYSYSTFFTLEEKK